MEIIKNYLESMFANLPNTSEIIKAKQELYSMMEDKYTELKDEGKADNEAVAIVISEFGNLDELSETLGIQNAITEQPDISRRPVSKVDAFEFIRENEKHKFTVGIAVLLFITCAVGPILGSSDLHHGSNISELIGLVYMFASIATGVGLIIYSSVNMKKWDYLMGEPCSIDYATADEIHRADQDDRPSRALRLTIGIILCILCFIPVVIFDALNSGEFLVEAFGPAFLLAMVGVGVMLIIMSGAKHDACSKLLALNDRTTVSGNYSGMKPNAPRFSDPTVDSIMSVYWPTVTCLYLIWSFLSFDWHITWIIWPVAGIIHGVVKKTYGIGGNNYER